MTSERRCEECGARALATDVTCARCRVELPDWWDHPECLNAKEALRAERRMPRPRGPRGMELDTACALSAVLGLAALQIPSWYFPAAVGATVMAIIGLRNISGSERGGASLAFMGPVFVASPVLVPLIDGLLSVIAVFITGVN